MLQNNIEKIDCKDLLEKFNFNIQTVELVVNLFYYKVYDGLCNKPVTRVAAPFSCLQQGFLDKR